MVIQSCFPGARVFDCEASHRARRVQSSRLCGVSCASRQESRESVRLSAIASVAHAENTRQTTCISSQDMSAIASPVARTAWSLCLPSSTKQHKGAPASSHAGTPGLGARCVTYLGIIHVTSTLSPRSNGPPGLPRAIVVMIRLIFLNRATTYNPSRGIYPVFHTGLAHTSGVHMPLWGSVNMLDGSRGGIGSFDSYSFRVCIPKPLLFRSRL